MRTGVKATSAWAAPTLAEHILPGICQQLLAEAEKVTIDLKVSMNDALLKA
jgi:hypothetical protein